MQAVRQRNPHHIPCRFELPLGKTLKLLVPEDETAGWAMAAARARWKDEHKAGDGYFMFCNARMVSTSSTLKSLDDKRPEEVRFVVRKEATFG